MMLRALALIFLGLLIGGCQTAADRQYRDFQTILEYEARR
jgi:outer membrane lipoprotein-sorting protein